MSLILEALKKLEREKAAGERGYVVLSHLPWVGARSGQGRIVAVGLGVAAFVIALGGWALWRGRGSDVARPASAVVPNTTLATAPSATPATAPTAAATDTTLAAPVAPAHAAAPRDRPPADTGPTTTLAPAPAPATDAAPAPADAPAPSEAAASQGAPIDKGARMVLNAISVRDGHPVAILNDRLVRVGDSFDGIRILRIGEAEVEVEIDGQRRILRF